MQIKDFNKKFNKKLKKHQLKWNYDARILHLIEEIGEFATIEMQRRGYKHPYKNKKDVAIALADILDDVFALAEKEKIKIEELFKIILNE